jgi:3-oxoadipate enol-lactonase
MTELARKLDMKTNEVNNGTAIHFIRTGPRGETLLVFIHALGLDLSVWDNQFKEFGRNRDVICVDLPGH